MKPNLLKERLNYIDWLRVMAVLMLFIYHTGRIFCSKYFYVKNVPGSDTATFIVTFIGQWHMHLFMLLAGIGTYFALKFRNPGEYIHERFLRLLVPLIFGTLVLIPPIAYFRLLGDPDRVWPSGFSHNAPGPGYNEGYFSFYPKFFNGRFPNGNMEWGHLWFLAYLFTFSIIAILVIKFIRSRRGIQLTDILSRLTETKFGIFIFAVPVALFEISLRWRFPGMQNLVSDWANFLTYFTVFISGYIVMTDERILQAIDRTWRTALVLGMTLNALLVANLDFHTGTVHYGVVIYTLAMITKSISIWSILIGFIGLGRRFLNFDNAFLGYVKEAAMPYYLLHQTAVITIGFFIVQLDMGVAPKYIAIVIGSLVTTALAYEIAVRRFSAMRFLLGIKGRL